MRVSARVEINFHEQEQISIYLETTSSGEEELYSELCLFACMALRQMANFGAHPIAFSLATFLSSVDRESLEEIIRAPRTDDIPDIVPYQGRPGRKRFVATVSGNEASLRFNLSAKGFGILGRGVGYYAPVSVMTFLRYLAARHDEDVSALETLASVANMCGHMYGSGAVNIRNQAAVAAEVVRGVWEGA